MGETGRRRFVVDLHLVLRQDGELLLGRRRNTGFGDGMFHLPAGHLEEGETLLEGMIREASEELAIEIAERDLSLVHVMLHSTGRIAFFFEATQWAGKAINNEPDKCAELRWFPSSGLPDNLVSYARAALASIESGKAWAASAGAEARSPLGRAGMNDLLSALDLTPAVERLGEGAVVLRRFAADETRELAASIGEIAAGSPFRHMITPGGFRMSVAMTNCGEAGWVTDRSGYRYSRHDPQTGRPWPAMPPRLQALAAHAAAAGGFPDFVPDACLINRYEPGAKLSLHRDEDERDLGMPVVSVSLGLPAVFLWGGLSRKDRVRRVALENGDVVVWGGAARLVYHGIAPLAEGEHPSTGSCRINLTLRKAL